MKQHLDLVYKYYPWDIFSSDVAYLSTLENIEQWKLIENARNDEKSNNAYDNMIGSLVKYLNCSGEQNFSLRGIFDLCRKSVLFLPANHYNEEFPCCVINVSIVSNYYCIYFTKFTGIPINTLQDNEINESQKSLIDNFISPIIKTYFNGYKPFPMEYFSEQIPGVYSSKNYSQYATYFDCLMTDDIF